MQLFDVILNSTTNISVGFNFGGTKMDRWTADFNSTPNIFSYVVF